jgi:hypothetical protein
MTHDETTGSSAASASQANLLWFTKMDDNPYVQTST